MGVTGITQGADANLGEYIKEQSQWAHRGDRSGQRLSGHWDTVKHEAKGPVPQIPWTPVFQDKGHIPDRRVSECAAGLLGKIDDSISIPDPKDFSPTKLLSKLYPLHHLRLTLLLSSLVYLIHSYISSKFWYRFPGPNEFSTYLKVFQDSLGLSTVFFPPTILWQSSFAPMFSTNCTSCLETFPYSHIRLLLLDLPNI